MATQALLPIFPVARPLGRPDPDAEAIRRRAGVEYFELPIREILNRSDSPHLPFAWTINPYRGCELGCTYCYARYTHGFFDFDNWQDFETKIFVKQRAAESLRRRLKRIAPGEPIAIGTATDPYQPAERHHGVTRSLLEVFADFSGLELWLTTKSPLILRDLDLLVELDTRHSIEVHVTLTTVDAHLARSLEPQAPAPSARLSTIARLAEAGLAVSVNCMPVMPGINDGEEVLGPLFAAAREAGARDVQAQALFLKPAARARFFPWLAEELPSLLPLYHRLYERRDYLDRAAQDQLLSDFRRLRLEHGFPLGHAGRC